MCFWTIGSKLFGKTAKSAAKKAAKAAATRTDEYAGKKAGDKIVQLLSKEKSAPTTKKVTFNKNVKTTPNKKKYSKRYKSKS